MKIFNIYLIEKMNFIDSILIFRLLLFGVIRNMFDSIYTNIWELDILYVDMHKVIELV